MTSTVRVGQHLVRGWDTELVKVLPEKESDAWRVESDKCESFTVKATSDEDLEYIVGTELRRRL